MHPAFEVRKEIRGRVHYATYATTSRRYEVAPPAGYDIVCLQKQHGAEVWYQHWVAPMPERYAEDEAFALLGLDLHFVALETLVERLVAMGHPFEWYKPHEPAAVEAAWLDFLTSDLSTEFCARFLDGFCRGQFLGNMNHRTAVAVLAALADWRATQGEGTQAVDHDATTLRTFNDCSKTVLAALVEPHSPRSVLRERHLDCCRSFVARTPWLQSMSVAIASEAFLREALSDLLGTGAG